MKWIYGYHIREKKPEVVGANVTDQSCKTYDEFIEKMGNVSENALHYFGIAICGPRKKVNKLTGSIPLLR